MNSSDDGDSRDSGYSDSMGSRPSSAMGTMEFLMMGEVENDMDEVFALEEEEVVGVSQSTATAQKSVCNLALERVKGLVDVTNSQAASLTRKTTIVSNLHGRMYKAKSSLAFSRKRTLEENDTEVETEAKRLRAVSTATSGYTEHNDTPPSRKFARRPPRVGIFQRVNSTSFLEVKPHTNSSTEPPQLASITYSLPVVAVKDTTAAFRRINANTLRSLITSLTSEEFLARYILVDCRYPYEYNGGHIQHAVNFYDTNRCEEFFFGTAESTSKIPIFYCEYSQKRGPGMAVRLRSVDRVRNVDCYPDVAYGEIYVLDQGYKGFFHTTSEEVIKTLCQPSDYVRMDDSRFGHELKKYNFHKKNCFGATSMKTEPVTTNNRSELVCDLRRRGARRGLFSELDSPAEHSSPALQPQRLTFTPSPNST